MHSSSAPPNGRNNSLNRMAVVGEEETEDESHISSTIIFETCSEQIQPQDSPVTLAPSFKGKFLSVNRTRSHSASSSSIGSWVMGEINRATTSNPSTKSLLAGISGKVVPIDESSFGEDSNSAKPNRIPSLSFGPKSISENYQCNSESDGSASIAPNSLELDVTLDGSDPQSQQPPQPLVRTRSTSSKKYKTSSDPAPNRNSNATSRRGSKSNDYNNGTPGNSNNAPPGMNSATNALDHFHEYGFHTVRKKLSWSFELPDQLIKEYREFYIDKTSLGWLIFSSIAMLYAIFPVSVFNVYWIASTVRNQYFANNGDVFIAYYFRLVIEIFRMLCCLFASIAGCYLSFLQRNTIYDIWQGIWSTADDGQSQASFNESSDDSNDDLEAGGEGKNTAQATQQNGSENNQQQQESQEQASDPTSATSSLGTIAQSSPNSKNGRKKPWFSWFQSNGHSRSSAAATAALINSNRPVPPTNSPESIGISQGSGQNNSGANVNNNNSDSNSNGGTSGRNKETDAATARHQAFVRTVRHFYILTYQLAFVLPIIQRTILTPDCNPSSNHELEQIATVNFQGGEVCSSFAMRRAAVLGNSYGMVFIPLVFFSHFPDISLKLMWFCLLLITVVCSACAAYVQLWDAIAIVLTLSMAVGLVVIDMQVRNIIVFLTTRKLKDMIRETERLAEQAHANEMRHMIANVAHDLKTPLSSFTTGVELIQFSFSEIYHNIGNGETYTTNAKALKDSLHAIQSGINNIRNTNSFMLMTINRCIDYTKATKGMKLVPRYETIDLRETLQLPMSCMINIQNRIEIKLKEIDMSKICSHIITDKQWLQENVLCLLSNAVKYSSEGTVTVSVFLDTEEESDILIEKGSVKQRKRRDGSFTKGKQKAIKNGSASTNGDDKDNGQDSSDKDTIGPPIDKSKVTAKKVDSDTLYSKTMTMSHDDTVKESMLIRGSSHIINDDLPSTTDECKASPSSSPSFVAAGSGNNLSTQAPSPDTTNGGNAVSQQKSGPLISPRSSKSPDNLDRFNFSSPKGDDAQKVRLHKESELAHHDKNYLRVEVEDTGIGMTDEAMASLFNAFKQTQRLAGGTGLGLFSLAKRMEAMNGRYGVMRRRDGLQGSLFWFSIPYRPDANFAEEAKKEAESGENVASSIISVPPSASFCIAGSSLSPRHGSLANTSTLSVAKFERKPSKLNLGSASSDPGVHAHVHVPLVPSAVMTPVSVASPNASSGSGGKGWKILLVDDSPAIIKMTSMMLKRMGHQITIAENGAMGVKCVIDNFNNTGIPFHAILMDLQMPVMDGLEATRRIRDFEKKLEIEQNIKYKHLVIGMSANSDSDTMEEAMAASIDLFMPKPFNMETFNSNVSSRINLNASTSTTASGMETPKLQQSVPELSTSSLTSQSAAVAPTTN